MDNLDDSENTAKISDSAYSNSCNNSQSRRSHSSKSTHSGSNSSGSSGYGGKPSTSGSSNNLSQPPEKRSKEKDIKKKKQETVTNVQNEVDCRPPEPLSMSENPKEEIHDVVRTPSPKHALPDNGVEIMDISTPEKCSLKDEPDSSSIPEITSMNMVTSRPSSYCAEGFSCVISMHDGVVMYTTSSLTTSLGFPKDMWIGRSFIDFVHPRDRNTFASQITSGLAAPKNANGTQEKVESPNNSVSTMFCRIRRYRGLTAGFGVKDRVVTFMPFLLKLSFKNVSDEEGKVIYLFIQATPFLSAYKTANEVVSKGVPFVMRHIANGNFEYIDSESVPYLGYLPQDITDKDALQLYHPNDLEYLQQVYETIVKEGGSPRSKPYRFMTQNGHYVKLETEWSSFINPWSRKLEFVIGKHYIIEGPSNPDVFQSPELDKSVKFSEEEKNKAQALRENIVRIMNEVLTKPAELAKQQMSKRCQDLASFMESLMEEQPKIDDELQLEIHDPDHSYYYQSSTLIGKELVFQERDSVMLGGISPHHDYNDSKSSTDTPLSYNQLNYNETLQRYFNSHQPDSYEDYNTVAGENILGLKDPKTFISNILSPMAQNSGDSGELTSSCESSGAAVGSSTDVPLGNYQPLRLTETLLTKHNIDMEKELVRKHRETRSSTKQEKDKVSNETRQKKKEHLARCNASFQPTAGEGSTIESQLNGVKRVAWFLPGVHKRRKHHMENRNPHGVKRGSKQADMDQGPHKHHCSTSRQSRRRHTTSSAPAQPSTTITTTVAATQWSVNSMSNMNAFVPGIGIPQQMSIMSPVAAMPGMFPMYYVPAAGPPIHTSIDVSNPHQSNVTHPPQYPAPAVQYMMYGQAVFGSPFVYSPISPPVSFPLEQTLMAQRMQYTNTPSPLGLTSSNYEESTEAVPDTNPSSDGKNKATIGNSDETLDRTDESSYSSFYSSFFKTESGSAEESGDAKKAVDKTKYWDKNASGDIAVSLQSPLNVSNSVYEPHSAKKIARRKIEPPWMEQVSVTSELIYKYQIMTKSMDEVLSADKQKLISVEQPSLVNEQLGQLYLDLQLEGVASRLTLEEGITSSSSSGEETSSKGNTSKAGRRKREYSKLVMIYEENAPLPPPTEGSQDLPSPFAS